ncbi:TonB-dependent receptor domain-containing protein [Croceiramulus getboli]|nr:TonB-dependent receptor [Flavobacteriaceae bacterium YJPT1-3]
MNQNLLKSLLSLIVFAGALSAYAQEEQDLDTEVVNIVKPYTPSISDAFKIKATPQLDDSVNVAKKQVTYGIFSVPVASTFTPAKGKAANVKKARPVKLFDNYVTLAFGTYSSALAEFYSNYQIDRNQNFGIYLDHNSSQGNIEDVELEDKFYDTSLNLNYTSRDRDFTWRGDLDFQHQLYNWYGLEDPSLFSAEDLNNIEPRQQYYTAAVGANFEMEDSFFDGGQVKLRYFGDATSSTELRAFATPQLELPIAGELIQTKLVIDYVQGEFDRNYFNSQGINYGFLNAGLNPSLVILRDDLTVNLGIAAFVSYDIELQNTNFNLYPRITGSYRVAGEYFIAYAGLEGELRQNSYYDVVQENPFVSPILLIQPTDQAYDAYVGIKGKVSNEVSYNLRGSYTSENDRRLFKNNPRFTPADASEGYQYGNSFGLVYDDLKTTSIFGELNVDVNANFKVRINGTYYSYSTDQQEEAWNLPDLEAALFADYQISEHWFAGANLFFVGERPDQRSTSSPTVTPFPVDVTLDSYFDINAHAGYRFNDQLSAFARVNNVLGNNYQRWVNFPVQGIQAMAGATYKFDF